MHLISSLRFRKKNALKAAKKISHLAKKSDLFSPRKKENCEIGYELTTDTDPNEEREILGIGTQFRPENWLSNTLERLYGREKVLGTKKITYQWLRKYDNEGNWIDVYEFHLNGRELCKDYLLGLHGYKDYDSCSCPKKFREYCKETNEILKKYAFKS